MDKIERFIVVDDDLTNNLLCEYILRRAYPTVSIILFSIPEKALEHLCAEYITMTASIPTVLLLDINMPTISGWEFLDEFNKLPKKFREQFTIFILSSSVDERDKAKADSIAAVSGFLCKPLSIMLLKGLLEQTANNSF